MVSWPFIIGGMGGSAIFFVTTTFLSRLVQLEAQEQQQQPTTPRVAIVGGGIGGTFAARYLAQSDVSCQIEAVTLFDPQSRLRSSRHHRYRGEDEDEHNPIGHNSTTPLLWQGPRTSSLELDNGLVVELGASILFSGNTLVTEVVDADPALEKVDPSEYEHNAGKEMDDGFGIYDGNGVWSILSSNNDSDAWYDKFKWLIRYNVWDLFKIRRAVLQAFHSFTHIYTHLDDDTTYSGGSMMDEEKLWKSPTDIWKAVKLYEPTRISFDEYLDSIGVSRSSNSENSKNAKNSQTTTATTDNSKKEEDFISKGHSNRWTAWFTWIGSTVFKWFVPNLWFIMSQMMKLPYSYQSSSSGRLRDEILTAISLCNYNQNDSQLNGLAGLVSFLPSQGQVYKIKGGNTQILQSAFSQAQAIHTSHCNIKKNNHNPHRLNQPQEQTQRYMKDDGTYSSNISSSRVQHVSQGIQSIVLDEKTGQWELYASNILNSSVEEEPLGIYSVVILAAPLQQCQISFWTRRRHERPHVNLNNGTLEELSLIGIPSPSTKRAYTQTVTTIVSHAVLQPAYFHFDHHPTSMPTSIAVTEKGKEVEGFSAISQLTMDEPIDATNNETEGTFKLFSSLVLPPEQLRALLGPNHVVEHIKVWGGPHGGAYPDFHGGAHDEDSVPFLIHSQGLYYSNAMESSVSAMEVSAIGAKAVTKLVAHRLGLFRMSPSSTPMTASISN